MGEIAIRLGESVCMAAADARWIGSHLNCYRLDRMEDVGASLLLTCAGLLAAAILTCRRPRRRPALAARTSRPGAARRLDLLAAPTVVASPWDSGRLSLSPGIAVTGPDPSAKPSSHRSGWRASPVRTRPNAL
jgi:hypothetical protein